MTPTFLVPEQVVRQDGAGPVLDLGSAPPAALAITFGITRVVEQESIDLCVLASADGETFDPKPVAAFPQKFYCGTYTLHVDLSGCPDARYLKASWKMNRWGRGDSTPLFSFYVFAEAAAAGAMAAAS